jgi:prephenate dehydratase
VVGETSLLVRHNLLRTTPSLDGIEVVLAHPQALAQCQGWLNTHLPEAERRAVSSNAEGARLAACIRTGPASPASAQPPNSACTSLRTRSRMTPSTAPALP